MAEALLQVKDLKKYFKTPARARPLPAPARPRAAPQLPMKR